MASDSTPPDHVPAPGSEEVGASKRRRRRRRRKRSEPQASPEPAAAAERGARRSPPRREPRRRREAPLHELPERPEALAALTLRALRELVLTMAHDRGVSRDDAADALGWFGAQLAVSTDARREQPADTDDVRLLLDSLEQQIDTRLRAAGAFRHGHVYDFLSDSPDAPSTRPPQPEATFCGYSPTGRPCWQSFTNLCLERRLERVDRLYAERPEIIALVQTGTELTQGLLQGFGRDSLAFNVLGQVVAGLIPASLDPHDRESPRIALTVQLVETRAGDASRRLRVNLLGLTPQAIVDAAASGAARAPAERLRRVVRATRHRLDVMGRTVARLERRGEVVDAAQMESLVRPILSQLRGDLERLFRPVHRRTRHAQERHLDGERPTSDAMHDALTAGDEQLLEDVERGTVVVLGPRGRAHVFTQAGRHVTSLRLAPGELERKLERGRWRRGGGGAARDGLEAWRERLVAAQRDEDDLTSGRERA